MAVSGLDADLRAKQAAKYDVDLERQVCSWIASIVPDMPQGDMTVGQWLHDGKVLCALVNAIQPGRIKKVNTMNAPFKQMENITYFTDAARAFGVKESAMFGTPDLYEEKNLGVVIHTIHNFAGCIQSSVPEFTGPKLGEAIAASSVVDAKRDKVAATQCGGLSGTLEQQKIATGARQAAPDAHDAASEVGANAGGLDADLKRRQSAKYDLGLEAAVVHWIEEIVPDTPKGGLSVAEWLKDGKVLCALVNAIKPGTIKKVNTMNAPFKQMENITYFMNAARELGVPESSMFGTPDLYEEKNMGSVINCLNIFGGAIQISVPEFAGPKLGNALNVASADKARDDRMATSQSEAMQRNMEVERPRNEMKR